MAKYGTFQGINQGITPYLQNISNMVSNYLLNKNQQERQTQIEAEKLAKETEANKYKLQTQAQYINQLPENLATEDLLYMAQNPDVAQAYNFRQKQSATQQKADLAKTEAETQSKVIADLLSVQPGKQFTPQQQYNFATLPSELRTGVTGARKLQPEYEYKTVENNQGFKELRYVNKQNPSDYQVLNTQGREVSRVTKETDKGDFTTITYSDGKNKWTRTEQKLKNLKQDGTNLFKGLDNDWRSYQNLLSQGMRYAQEGVYKKEDDVEEARTTKKTDGGYEYTDKSFWGDSQEQVFSPQAEYYANQAEELRKQKITQIYDNMDDDLKTIADKLSDNPEVANQMIQNILDKTISSTGLSSGNVERNKEKLNEIANKYKLLKYYYRFRYNQDAKWAE